MEGFIKAGFKGDLSNYSKVQKDQKLRQQEIEKLVTGRILSGFHHGLLRTMSNSKDGTSILSYSKKGKTLIKTNGKIWVEGDSICCQYKRYDNLQSCGEVYFNSNGSPDDKNEYLWLTDFALLPFSIQQKGF